MPPIATQGHGLRRTIAAARPARRGRRRPAWSPAATPGRRPDRSMVPGGSRAAVLDVVRASAPRGPAAHRVRGSGGPRAGSRSPCPTCAPSAPIAATRCTRSLTISGTPVPARTAATDRPMPHELVVRRSGSRTCTAVTPPMTAAATVAATPKSPHSRVSVTRYSDRSTADAHAGSAQPDLRRELGRGEQRPARRAARPRTNPGCGADGRGVPAHGQGRGGATAASSGSSSTAAKPAIIAPSAQPTPVTLVNSGWPLLDADHPVAVGQVVDRPADRHHGAVQPGQLDGRVQRRLRGVDRFDALAAGSAGQRHHLGGVAAQHGRRCPRAACGRSRCASPGRRRRPGRAPRGCRRRWPRLTASSMADTVSAYGVPRLTSTPPAIAANGPASSGLSTIAGAAPDREQHVRGPLGDHDVRQALHERRAVAQRPAERRHSPRGGW